MSETPEMPEEDKSLARSILDQVIEDFNKNRQTAEQEGLDLIALAHAYAMTSIAESLEDMCVIFATFVDRVTTLLPTAPLNEMKRS